MSEYLLSGVNKALSDELCQPFICCLFGSHRKRFTVRLKGLGFLPFGVPSDLFVSRVELLSLPFLCDTRCSASQTDTILQNLVHKPRIC